MCGLVWHWHWHWQSIHQRKEAESHVKCLLSGVRALQGMCRLARIGTVDGMASIVGSNCSSLTLSLAQPKTGANGLGANPGSTGRRGVEAADIDHGWELVLASST